MKHRQPLAALFAAVALFGACASDASGDSAPEASDVDVATTNDSSPVSETGPRTIELPGESVFPEGVAYDETTGSVFVGSTDDGTIFRAGFDDATAEVFLAPGEDGRTAVTGLAVRDGILFVAGRDTGRIFAYDIETADLVAAHDTAGGERSLINDIAVSADFAYITDSFRPVLYRSSVAGDSVGEPEVWIDLTDTVIEFDPDGFNLNGIAITDDGTTLYTVHFGTGELFRIDTATGEIQAVDLDGEQLTGGDGLEIEGSTITAIAAGDLVTIDLDDTGLNATASTREPLDDLLFPTTVALTEDSYIIVNSQLNMTGADNQPVTPFTLSVLER